MAGREEVESIKCCAPVSPLCTCWDGTSQIGFDLGVLASASHCSSSARSASCSAPPPFSSPSPSSCSPQRCEMEEELSMKLILQMTSSERQTPALPSQQVQRGLTEEWAEVDEVLGWQEAKRSGRGESQGRRMNWPPLETPEQCFKGELSLSSSSQRAVGSRGIGQDVSKSEGKGFKSNYKTVLCEFWNTTGRCQYGPGCHFAHGEGEIKRQTEVNRAQQMQEGKVSGTALKSEEQRRAADKVCTGCNF